MRFKFPARLKRAHGPGKRAVESQPDDGGRKAASQQVTINSLNNPPCDLVARNTPSGATRLLLVSLDSSNKKLMKETVMYTWTKHMMLSTRAPPDNIAYTLTPKTLVLCDVTLSVMSVAKCAKNAAVVQIWGYQAFPAGAVPKVLTPLRDVTHRLSLKDTMPEPERVRNLGWLRVARDLIHAQVFWVMTAKTENGLKILEPKGVALINPKQIVLHGGKELDLGSDSAADDKPRQVS